MDQIVSIGLILIVLGVLVLLFGLFASNIPGKEKNRGEVRGGAVIFIGPIPIILGTDKGSVITVAVLSIIILTLAYFFMRR